MEMSADESMIDKRLAILVGNIIFCSVCCQSGSVLAVWPGFHGNQFEMDGTQLETSL